MAAAPTVAVLAAAATAPAVVRRVLDPSGAKRLEISLSLASRPTRTLSRRSDEAVRRGLARIAGVKGGGDGALAAAVALLRQEDGSEICLDAPAEEAWSSAGRLRVGGETVEVLYDPPEVVELASPAFPLVGVPLAPLCRTRHCEAGEVQLRWEAASSAPAEAGPASQWRPVGSGPSFAPPAGLAGYSLRVIATPPPLPGRSPLEASRELGSVVEPPARPLLEARLRSLGGGAEGGGGEGGDRLRVMSYNCLADTYRRSWDEPGSVHSYCDPSLTAGGLRLPRLLSEVLAASPDVAALQEVDVSWARRFWEPSLAAAGYAMAFAPKASASSNEGLAVAWRTSAFELVRARVCRLDLREPPPPLAEYLSQRERTAAAVRLPTAAQRRSASVSVSLFTAREVRAGAELA